MYFSTENHGKNQLSLILNSTSGKKWNKMKKKKVFSKNSKNVWVEKLKIWLNYFHLISKPFPKCKSKMGWGWISHTNPDISFFFNKKCFLASFLFFFFFFLVFSYLFNHEIGKINHENIVSFVMSSYFISNNYNIQKRKNVFLFLLKSKWRKINFEYFRIVFFYYFYILMYCWFVCLLI